jgi:hypothetical protein
MHRSIGGVVSCGAALGLVILATACQSATHRISRTARVSGGADVELPGEGRVSEAELWRWVSSAPSAAAFGRPVSRQRVLSFLRFCRWVLGEARELGIAVEPGEANRQLEELDRNRAEGLGDARPQRDRRLRALLDAPELGRIARVWLMSIALLIPKLESVWVAHARRAIPRSRIKRFYAAHARQFYLPDQREVEIIAGSAATVSQAKHEIEAGQPFLTVAQRLSIDPEAPGGLWHLVRGHDEPPVEGTIFAARPNVLVGPKRYSLYYIFKVLTATPAHQQPLGEVEGRIRREMAPTPGQLLAASEAHWFARMRNGHPTPIGAAQTLARRARVSR